MLLSIPLGLFHNVCTCAIFAPIFQFIFPSVTYLPILSLYLPCTLFLPSVILYFYLAFHFISSTAYIFVCFLYPHTSLHIFSLICNICAYLSLHIVVFISTFSHLCVYLSSISFLSLPNCLQMQNYLSIFSEFVIEFYFIVRLFVLFFRLHLSGPHHLLVWSGRSIVLTP